VAHDVSWLQLHQSALQSLSLDKSSSGVIFKDIHDLVRESFFFLKCFHVSRSCNSCAHEIAAQGLNQSLGSENTWEYPSQVAAFHVGTKLIEKPKS